MHKTRFFVLNIFSKKYTFIFLQFIYIFLLFFSFFIGWADYLETGLSAQPVSGRAVNPEKSGPGLEARAISDGLSAQRDLGR